MAQGVVAETFTLAALNTPAYIVETAAVVASSAIADGSPSQNQLPQHEKVERSEGRKGDRSGCIERLDVRNRYQLASKGSGDAAG